MMGRYQSERRRLGLEFLEPRQVLSASGISSDFVIGINHTEICRLDESMSVALGNLDPAEEQLTNSLNQTLSRYLNRIRSRLSATTPVQTESDGSAAGKWSFTRPSTGDTFTVTVEPIGTMRYSEGTIESTLHLYSISLRQSSSSANDRMMDYDNYGMLVQWSPSNGFGAEAAFPDTEGQDEAIASTYFSSATDFDSVNQQLASDQFGHFVVHSSDDHHTKFPADSSAVRLATPDTDGERHDEDGLTRLAVEQDEAIERLLELGDDSYYFLKHLSAAEGEARENEEAADAYSHGQRGEEVDAFMAEEAELRQLEGAAIELVAHHDSPRPTAFSSDPVSIDAIPGLFRAFVIAGDVVDPVAAPARSTIASGKREDTDEEVSLESDSELIAYIQDARLLLPAVLAGGAILWERETTTDKRRRWLRRETRV